MAFLGSNFFEQGKRAADAIKATGGTGKVAILLASSGNNVTSDRTKGFVDQSVVSGAFLVVVVVTQSCLSRIRRLR
ncbi:hypothetical protein [Asanoa iriomotensis]|uniref:hypothetical protein n=1 Tax=Asanoa iriomotensis TaxID=234613 RepID=UPI001EF21856|nr:hypothetical protein [Asanoa iriomotensis]